jgi:hypothetical protein
MLNCVELQILHSVPVCGYGGWVCGYKHNIDVRMLCTLQSLACVDTDFLLNWFSCYGALCG